MSPILEDGDYVLTLKPRRLKPGFIYVVDHPDLGRIVKRLVKIQNGKAYWQGENVASTPSSVIGSTHIHRISARAWLAIKPKGLRRL